MPPIESQHRIRSSLAWFTIGLWFLYFLVSVGASYDERQAGGFRPNTITIYAVTSLAGIGICALMHRFLATMWQLPTRMSVIGLALILLAVVFFHALLEEFAWIEFTSSPVRFWSQVWWMGVIYVWVYAAWLLGVSRIHASALLRQQQQRLADAEATAQRATIAALQQQLNPHFLFNALNTISALVMSNHNERAEATIAKLSQLLRLTLETSEQEFVDLDMELRLVRAYLDVESERYAHRMSASISREPGLGLAMIPPILLQPLVENAVKHAVQPSEHVVTIEVSAIRRDDCLVLQVSNDGGPSNHQDAVGFGIGLDNIRRRLDALYGAAASVTILAPAEGGFTARLVLPYRSAGVATWPA